MNKTKKWTRLLGLVAFAAVASFLAGSAWAQQKTVEERSAGPNRIEVQLKHSTVVLVEGNHLVTRLHDGTLEAILIPEDFRFHMDGEALSVHQLKPGMILSETVRTTERPTIVRTVEIHDGTIWHVQGEYVYIRDKHTTKARRLHVPSWATVMVDGEKLSVHDLHPDMTVNATFITEEPVNVTTTRSRMDVRHPAEEAKPAVAQHPVTTQLEENARTEPATQAEPAELPATASPLPLIAMLGLFSLTVSFWAARRNRM